MFKCNICGKENPENIFRCEEHYFCDDCGTKENLCTYTEGVLCYTCHKKRVEKRITEFTGDTDFQPEIVCPYCGYAFTDSWEMSDGEYDCEDCERTFTATRNVEVSYSTAKN